MLQHAWRLQQAHTCVPGSLETPTWGAPGNMGCIAAGTTATVGKHGIIVLKFIVGFELTVKYFTTARRKHPFCPPQL